MLVDYLEPCVLQHDPEGRRGAGHRMRRVPYDLELVHERGLLVVLRRVLIDDEYPSLRPRDSAHLHEHGDRLPDVMEGLGTGDQVCASGPEWEPRPVTEDELQAV